MAVYSLRRVGALRTSLRTSLGLRFGGYGVMLAIGVLVAGEHLREHASDTAVAVDLDRLRRRASSTTSTSTTVTSLRTTTRDIIRLGRVFLFRVFVVVHDAANDDEYFAAHHHDDQAGHHLGRYKSMSSALLLADALRFQRRRDLSVPWARRPPCLRAARGRTPTRRNRSCAPRWRPSTGPAVASVLTQSSSVFTPTWAIPSRFPPCSSEPSTSPTRLQRKLMVPWTRRLVALSWRSATTGTSKQLELVRSDWLTSVPLLGTGISNSITSGVRRGFPKAFGSILDRRPKPFSPTGLQLILPSDWGREHSSVLGATSLSPASHPSRDGPLVLPWTLRRV